MITLHLIITGKVQGVFFRATAKEIASKLSVTGWIKNTKDGNVEAIVTGSKDQIDQFVSWCKKGPERAKVLEVIITEQEETTFEGFTVVRGV